MEPGPTGGSGRGGAMPQPQGSSGFADRRENLPDPEQTARAAITRSSESDDSISQSESIRASYPSGIQSSPELPRKRTPTRPHLCNTTVVFRSMMVSRSLAEPPDATGRGGRRATLTFDPTGTPTLGLAVRYGGKGMAGTMGSPCPAPSATHTSPRRWHSAPGSRLTSSEPEPAFGGYQFQSIQQSLSLDGDRWWVNPTRGDSEASVA